jgi:hypothetical protein
VAEKIFVELDEEIIFIVEKLKKIDGSKAILVVPDRAALLGSVVSLKLLAQEVSKTNKLAVVVTQDEVGRRLAEKANFVAVEKVNDISKEKWEKARQLKKEIIERREAAKKKLVKERKEDSSISEEESKEPSHEALPAVGPLASVDKLEGGEEARAVGELKRLDPQKVDLEGFEMMAGGDIAELEGGGERDSSVLERTTRGEDAVASSRSEVTQDEEGKQGGLSSKDLRKEKVVEATKDSRKDRGLVGRDLSSFSYTSIPQKGKQAKVGGKGLDVKGFIDQFMRKIKDFFSKGGSKQKLIIIAFGILIVFFALSYFVFPQGKVLIKVESRDIELTKEVIADTATPTLDVESLTIPAQLLEVIKDRSGSTDATGVKETGEHAGGQVTLFNVTASEASVPSGTILESVETGLRYKTTSDVTVDAREAEEEGGGLGVADVGIIADSFGEDYNVSTKQEFRVQGYDVENLYGKNFSNITGGTTEEKKVVSQQDYDGLKSSLEEELKTDLLSSLQSEAGTSRELLEDTVSYEVINEDPTPAVNEEATTLNLSISVKATALSFKKDDVDELAQFLVEEENQVDIEVEEFEYSSEVLGTEGNQIFINLEITGVVTPSVNQDDVKTNLIGKSRAGAEEYLGAQEEIEDFEIELRPSWLPSFLKHFPSSTSRIEVNIEKV